jgi:hypothetical protein
MDWIIVLLVYAVFIYGVYKLAKSKNSLVVLAIMQKLPETKKRVNKKKVSKKIK